MPETIDVPLTEGELIQALRDQDLLSRADADRIEAAHGRPEVEEPWFARLLIILGAWIAAISFLGCLIIANLIDEHWWSQLGWACLFLVAAVLLGNRRRGLFLAQLALALSALGHFFALQAATSLTDYRGQTEAVAAAAMILCVVLYPLYRDPAHRFLSCLLAASCITTWIVEDQVWALLHVEMLAKILAIGIVFMYRPRWFGLRPLGYAMAVSVTASLFLVLLPENVFAAPWWPANLLLMLSLIWLYQWIAGGWDSLRSEPLLVATGATVFLACFTTPGLLAALGLMILGYARRDRWLLGIGTLFFPIFIVVFYYDWQVSLLAKSWIMAGSGAVLLGARWIMNHRQWTTETV